MNEREIFPNLDQVFNSINDLVIFLKPDGTIFHCNESFSKFVKLPKEQIIGKKCYELVHKIDTFYQNCPLKRSLSSGKRETNEYEKNGQFFNVDVDPIKNSSGEIVAFIHIMRDLTDYKKVEQKLKKSEEKYRAIVDNAVEAIVIVQDEIIKYANPYALKLSGFKEEEVIGRNYLEFVHPEDRAIAQKLYREIMKSTVSTSHINVFRIFDKEGNVRWVEVNGVCIDYEEGKADLSFLRDITDLKKAETEKNEMLNQLTHLQKIEAIGRLSSGIAHELNNVITAIKGFAQLALSKIDEKDENQLYLKNILEASEKAEKITNRLFAFCKDSKVERKLINLNDFIKDLEDFIKKTVGDDVTLFLLLSPDIAPVEADPHQLESVIMGIVSNARDAMPNGGSLTVETRNFNVDEEFVRKHKGSKVGDYVRLSIKDTGVGIPEEVGDRVFEPFFTTKKEKTSGLGLSIIFTIVKQHDGYIWYESELGRGTTFHIIFPAKALKEQKERKKETQLPKGTETILVVDDNELVRTTTVEMLKRLGYKTLEAKNQDIALFFAQFYPKPIDLILCDVVMPGMNGIKLCSKVKQHRPEIKVLFMSGYSDDVTSKHGLNRETMDFLQKPFTIETLARKIREVLERN